MFFLNQFEILQVTSFSPPSLTLKGFWFGFNHPENLRGHPLSSVPWGRRGTVVSWANRFVGVRCRPAPRRRPAVRRPAPIRPWYVRVLDSTGKPFPCEACPGNFSAGRKQNVPFSFSFDPHPANPNQFLSALLRSRSSGVLPP